MYGEEAGLFERCAALVCFVVGTWVRYQEMELGAAWKESPTCLLDGVDSWWQIEGHPVVGTADMYIPS